MWTIYRRVREYGAHVQGIWTEDQTEGWRRVVSAVHAKGEVICCQLLHTGRIAQPEIGEHPLVKGTGATLPPVSSSATAIPVSQEEGNQYNWDQPQNPATGAWHRRSRAGDRGLPGDGAQRGGSRV